MVSPRRQTSEARRKIPAVVGVNLASGSYEYLTRALELGALEGRLGKMNLHPALKPVIEAMHHVLAGGEVDIKVTRQGNPDIVADLNHRLRQGFEETNKINSKAGYLQTRMV